MKNYLIKIVAEIPYPHEFIFRFEARTMGRALDFAWRELRKNSHMKCRRETALRIHVTPLGSKFKMED